MVISIKHGLIETDTLSLWVKENDDFDFCSTV
jgi:hypothetical protein